MNIFNKLLYAFWQQDFELFSDPSLVWTIYCFVFIILFLENGLLPAAFLPGDSLLILLGVLISKGMLHFPLVIFVLTVSSSLGSWISYLQGKWLKNNRLVKIWLAHLPKKYHQRANFMFYRYGLSALLISRFIAFIRTLLPTIVGLSRLGSFRFHFFNWVSAFLWVLILTMIGFFIGKTTVFQKYERAVMLCLILLPLVLLIIGLLSSLVLILRRKRFINSDKKK